MPLGEVEALVNRVIDQRLATFRQQVDLEFAPIRIALESHERQLGEVRSTALETSGGLARIDGKMDMFIEEMRHNHQENQRMERERLQQTSDLLTVLHTHIGEHNGEQREAERTLLEAEREEEQRSRKLGTRMQWVRLIAGAGSISAVFKWIHDHWQKIQHHTK